MKSCLKTSEKPQKKNKIATGSKILSHEKIGDDINSDFDASNNSFIDELDAQEEDKFA